MSYIQSCIHNSSFIHPFIPPFIHHSLIVYSPPRATRKAARLCRRLVTRLVVCATRRNNAESEWRSYRRNVITKTPKCGSFVRDGKAGGGRPRGCRCCGRLGELSAAAVPFRSIPSPPPSSSSPSSSATPRQTPPRPTAHVYKAGCTASSFASVWAQLSLGRRNQGSKEGR